MLVRFKIGRHRIAFFTGKTEYVRGFESLVSGKEHDLASLHIPLFDFDHVDLAQVIRFGELINSPFFINKSSDGNYHLTILDIVSWSKYLTMLSIGLYYGLDYGFYRWTVLRGKGTLRYSAKNGKGITRVYTHATDEEIEKVFSKISHVVQYEVITK